MDVLTQFLSEPKATGMMTESCPELTDLMVRTAQPHKRRCIVEYGPGTGVITQEISRQIGPDTTFFCLETNPEFVRIATKRCPTTPIYHDSAAQIHTYLAQHQQADTDCIVSCLPRASFEPDEQNELMDISLQALEEEGIFLTLAFVHGLMMPAGRRFRALLNHQFSVVTTTEIARSNLPPAFVYYCQK